ncbi:Allantoicase [Xylographa bjoerkii]|nr:Allantoicase [Xylographa bjoerkii]
MDIQTLSPELVLPAEQPLNDAVSPELIDKTFGSDCIDLASISLTSRILAFSDEFFADASNLINPRTPVHRPGVFVPSGAWYDGWETRRHNPQPFDWVIIRLGVASGRPKGVEINTAFFNGNEAPVISVDGCYETAEGADSVVAEKGYNGWSEVLGKRPCGPSQRQAWKLEGQNDSITHVRLRMWPDGGIARFRLYGEAVPVWPSDPTQEIELSAAVMGGVAESCSDQHFGGKENLLLPGRGIDMGDGWETKRSRSQGHTDWVIVKLGARGKVSRIVIDTAHFRGNFPQGVMVEAADFEGNNVVTHGDSAWSELLPVQKVGPDQEFEFGRNVLLKVEERVFTHMKLTIIPDGGVKRFRVFGTRAL